MEGHSQTDGLRCDSTCHQEQASLGDARMSWSMTDETDMRDAWDLCVYGRTDGDTWIDPEGLPLLIAQEFGVDLTVVWQGVGKGLALTWR